MPSKLDEFKQIVWNYYLANKRDLPWRNTTEPYHIFISEVMLQQTQVNRIIPRYEEWLKTFPNFKSLAEASLDSVLRAWEGIGYNRRALFLKKSAEIITNQYGGKLPDNPIILETLPGIGKATAGSIAVYAFNKPLVFIETNVRRVYIHHFFQDQEGISDKDLSPLIEETLAIDNPREWYYALMDYGTYLAKHVENPNRRSKHYVKQSKFEGSNRQIRSTILKNVLKNDLLTKSDIIKLFEDEERVSRILDGLEKEGFLVYDKDKYKISYK